MKTNKLIALLLVFTALCLAGCGQGATGGASSLLDPKNPVTLTLWHYYVGENQQALESLISDFNQTIGIEKGVIIDAVAKGSIAELEQAVTDSAMGVINADPMPDIFSSYPDKAMEIDALQMVCDLNTYFSDEEKNLYVEGFVADGIFDGGRFLLVPIVKSTELLYVNATSWNEFAQSGSYSNDSLATWEGIYETARAYYNWQDQKTPDQAWDGKALMGFDSVANFVIISNKQLGVNVIDADGKQAILNQSALRKIFDVYYKGMSLGYFGAVGKFRSDDIKSGDLIAYVGSSSSAAYFPTWIEKNNAQDPIDFLPLAYPVFEGGEAYAIQQGAGMCVANSTPQKQEGAVLFLKWFTDIAQNIEFAMTTGYLPVQTAAYESDGFESALQNLRAGDAALQNVAGVYEIALHQILDSNTYAAKPFGGSYDVRSTLQSSLMAIAEEGQKEAAALKGQGKSEQEIIDALNLDAKFEQWLSNIRTRLGELEIAYSE